MSLIHPVEGNSRLIANCQVLGFDATRLSQITPFEAPKPLHDESFARGEYAEAKVAHVLSQIPIVESVERSKWRSLDDFLGIDLKVFLAPSLHWLYPTPIKVQVKSSKIGISQFSYSHAPSTWVGADTFAYREEELYLQGFIVINGQKREPNIANSFIRQLEEVYMAPRYSILRRAHW